MRKQTAAGLALVVGAAIVCLAERDARACGACMQGPPQPGQNASVVTDHRMILSISSQQTTLYDQVRYSGSPESFAWVLPISGAVTIGLSSDALFSALDSATSPTISAPPPPSCPPPPERYCPMCPQSYCPGDYGGASADGGNSNYGGDSGSAEDAAAPPVTVTMQETVGPYETVQLHSTDPNALENWLSSHGYVIPTDVQPIVAAYVAEHFDFLAMKLVPGAGVQAMRPVRVTMPGATTVLPLRMVAAGTGATVGMQLWIVGDGRYEPQNFPWFMIDASELTWDYAVERSNYSSVRAQKEASFNGRGWQVEASLTGVLSSVYFALLRSPASLQYDAIPGTDGGAGETADQARTDDFTTLLGGAMNMVSARVTSLRADLSRAALADDLVVQASQDQSTLSNALYVTNTANLPPCPVYPEPPPCPTTPDQCPPPPVCPNLPPAANAPNGETDGFASCATTSSNAASPEAIGSIAFLAIIVGARMRRRRAK
jgi:hypothetical protein